MGLKNGVGVGLENEARGWGSAEIEGGLEIHRMRFSESCCALLCKQVAAIGREESSCHRKRREQVAAYRTQNYTGRVRRS